MKKTKSLDERSLPSSETVTEPTWSSSANKTCGADAMRKTALYLLWIIISVGAIYGVIRYGGRLHPPASLPRAWSYALAEPASSCPLFAHEQGAMQLHQSGETISVVFHNAPDFDLHGKVASGGAFKLSGDVSRRHLPNCGKGKTAWAGEISSSGMRGIFTVAVPGCGLCLTPVSLTAQPETSD